MFPIDEAIKSSRSSTLFDSLEKSLKDIQENIERVVKDREANLDEIKQQHLKGLNDIKAQIFTAVPPRSKSIDDFTASLINEFQLPLGQSRTCITGSSVFPDGRMVFADCFFNNRLIIVQSDCSLSTEISLSPLYPFDVTCIDDKTVAVTMFSDNKIQIIDTKSKQVTKTINTGAGRGITYRQGQIIYCEKEKGIVGIQLSNFKIYTLVEDCTIKNNYSFIATSGENLYYTDNGYTVKCYSVKGDNHWEYKNKSIMNGVTGIAVDQHGIVSVISNSNERVVLISSDGKNSRTLLTAKDGITNSCGMYFHVKKLCFVSYPESSSNLTLPNT
ncbi:unnamed protein product [Mytilus edulis]|uniref:Uncharacterized protein n=1 Tax=Mytilus edulis TaxID=6550 RepID=A0A8S3V4F3_MYTED|nr:unnamed protein product [Mytilus edulis]